MHLPNRTAVATVVIATILAGVPATGLAAEPGPMILTQAEPFEPIATRTEITTARETVEPIATPISFSLGYAMYSDYIFRGVNFSEYDGEGREKLNHQLSTSVSVDLGWLCMGDLGIIGFDTWFEWFAGQKKIDPERGGQNLQEVDYVIWWSHAIEPIATDLTIAYAFYQFPNLAHALRQDDARGNNNDDRTQEYWFAFEHNDAWMWRWLFPDNEEGVLSPSFFSPTTWVPSPVCGWSSVLVTISSFPASTT